MTLSVFVSESGRKSLHEGDGCRILSSIFNFNRLPQGSVPFSTDLDAKTSDPRSGLRQSVSIFSRRD